MKIQKTKQVILAENSTKWCLLDFFASVYTLHPQQNEIQQKAKMKDLGKDTLERASLLACILGSKLPIDRNYDTQGGTELK